jgi:hypothetical protein
MTSAQRLWQVELPGAVARLLGGVRSAVLQVVATTTVAAYVGAGRLVLDGPRSGPGATRRWRPGRCSSPGWRLTCCWPLSCGSRCPPGCGWPRGSAPKDRRMRDGGTPRGTGLDVLLAVVAYGPATRSPAVGVRAPWWSARPTSPRASCSWRSTPRRCARRASRCGPAPGWAPVRSPNRWVELPTRSTCTRRSASFCCACRGTQPGGYRRAVQGLRRADHSQAHRAQPSDHPDRAVPADLAKDFISCALSFNSGVGCAGGCGSGLRSRVG